MDNNFHIEDYKAIDGIEVFMKLFPNGSEDFPDLEEWAKVAEGKAFTIFFEGKALACAGVIKQRKGVGLAWALYPPDIGDYHIDPRIAKDKLHEIIDQSGLWRVEATVRVDFPAGASYLRYMGFEQEGRMRQNEPDKSDSYLYSIVRKKDV